MNIMGDNGQALPALSPTDIDTTINHEPRIRDLRLAEALGMVDPHDIRRLIERHMAALMTFGEVFRDVPENRSSRQAPHTPDEPISDADRKLRRTAEFPRRRGRPSKGAFHLTKKQALYITAKSDTERSALVTIQMVEVFDAATGARTTGLPGTLAPEEESMVMAYRSLGRDDQIRLRALLTPPIGANSIPETRNPPFCAACKAADFWRRGIDTDLDPNPLLSSPLTNSDLRVIKTMRTLVAREIDRTIGLRILDATIAMQKAFRPDRETE
ncbi:hypothetical protein D3877_10110 [Azospirillum cavernae]|uniref:Uncharacterized protein n=1 Tax=Azospirillum cavernae TaxID=2320860 RepID=A0A418W462_9PROT|nr:hypothetical protein [Azospirillum cavernae]RJF84823.1 hypothetical protein D3877_10110 [Azospirillum cavernae]